MSDGGERRIALAAVAGAQGVKGELRLKLFSDSIDSLSCHQNLYVGGAKRRLLAIGTAARLLSRASKGLPIDRRRKRSEALLSRSIAPHCRL